MIPDLAIVRHPRARRARLRIDTRDGRATLTLPPRAALKPALAWAHGKADWIAAQRARLPTPRPIENGMTITVDDQPLTLRWQADLGRGVRRENAALLVGGPLEAMPRRIERWLKQVALDLLARETGEYAALAGVTVERVSIGDPRGRWGSCAAHGAIRYSWRLILAPGWVRRATVAHEVAHRVHMNHGAAFHALVEKLYGADPTPARAWLRTHGAALHWFGRSG